MQRAVEPERPVDEANVCAQSLPEVLRALCKAVVGQQGLLHGRALGHAAMFRLQARAALPLRHFGVVTAQAAAAAAVSANGKPLALERHGRTEQVSPGRAALPQPIAEREPVGPGFDIRVQGSQPAQPRHFCRPAFAAATLCGGLQAHVLPGAV